MAQALYRKWRPQTWDEVVGQEHVVRTLRNAVRGDRVGHAYLFAGPRGTGKTTTARLLAKAVNCLVEDLAARPCNRCTHCQAVIEGSFIDLIEIDAASNTSVEDVRDLRDKIHFAPNQGRAKVYIVDEVHMLSTAAFNALLKTLEEPPDHAVFILATTEVHKVPATVLSRCQRHEFRRLPVSTMVKYLQSRVEAEGLDVEAPVLDLIARQATGSLRDAVSLLDQLSSGGDQVDVRQARQVLGTATHEAVVGLVSALAEGNAGRGLDLVHAAMDGGADPRQLARQIVDYLRDLLLVQVGSADLVEISLSERGEMENLAGALPSQRLMRAIKLFAEAALQSRSDWLPGLPLELAVVESVADKAATSQAVHEAGAESQPGPDVSMGGVERRAEQTPAPAATPKEKPSQARKGEGEGGRAREPGRRTQLTYGQVVDHWKDILRATYQLDPRAQALLNSGKPLGLEAGEIVLGFASDLLREKMERGDNLENVSQAVEAVLGVRLGFRCVLTSRWQTGNAPEQAPPVEDDGMVAMALRDLGAQVREVRQVEEDDEETAG